MFIQALHHFSMLLLLSHIFFACFTFPTHWLDLVRMLNVSFWRKLSSLGIVNSLILCGNFLCNVCVSVFKAPSSFCKNDWRLGRCKCWAKGTCSADEKTQGILIALRRERERELRLKQKVFMQTEYIKSRNPTMLQMKEKLDDETFSIQKLFFHRVRCRDCEGGKEKL